MSSEADRARVADAAERVVRERARSSPRPPWTAHLGWPRAPRCLSCA